MWVAVKRKWTAALAGVLAAAIGGHATAQQAPADEAAAAKRLYMTKSCIACHGKEGKKAIQDYPDVAGQKADYIAAQMKDIIDGRRTGSPDASGNPRSKGMRGALVDPNGNRRISDEEISQIAKWLAAIEPRKPEAPATPLTEESKAKAAKLYAETCEACHGKTGREPLEGFPAIAGQKRAYVAAQMKDIKSKARSNGQSEAMQGAIAEMKDEDIELLADYVSQIDPGKP